MNEEREKQCSGDSSINKLLSIGITRAGGVVKDPDKDHFINLKIAVTRRYERSNRQLEPFER